jgi:hypothetical protein
VFWERERMISSFNHIDNRLKSKQHKNKTNLETAEMSVLRKIVGKTKTEHGRVRDIGDQC